MDIREYARKIEELVTEIELYKNFKKSVANAVTTLEIKHKNNKISQDEYKKSISKYLKGKSKKEAIQGYDDYIFRLLEQINLINSNMYGEFTELENQREKKLGVVSGKIDVVKGEMIGKKEKQSYLDELNLKKSDIKDFVKKHKKKEEGKLISEDTGYTIYTESKLGKFANLLFGRFTNWFTLKYPGLFKRLYDSLRVSDTRILSKTYVSITMLFTALTFIIAFVASIFLFDGSIWFNALRSFSVALVVSMLSFVGIYFYPISVIKSRSRKIKNELPFVAIHMAAVAGSGARPITIFKLILESGEYKVISVEIKKLMNYVNLFGYNLSTALKAVAATTPSYEFKELLNGMMSSIETGGDIKTYLKDKADELLNTYRLDRKKYIDSLSAYSDIYTGILIAAPLLFIVTLAIINVIGGGIGGVSANVLAKVGTYGVIPFLNIVFLLFLSIVQPKD